MSHSDLLRRDARACFAAAVAAVEPESLVRGFLEERPELLEVPGEIRLAGIGKAAAAMARGAWGVLGERLAGGVLIVPKGQEGHMPPGLTAFGGGHPVPDEVGVDGAQHILALAEVLGEGDLLLCLVSGGGSALMTLPPPGVTVGDVKQTTHALLRAGATIDEVNCVRKHLDRLKGGRLARVAYPARTLALVLSDVVGDHLPTIASGPASPDPTTYEEALRVSQRYYLASDLPATVLRHLERGAAGEIEESPKAGDFALERTHAEVIANNRLAAHAALKEANRRGYQTMLLSTLLTGEARQVGTVLASIGAEILRSGNPLSAPACIALGGETTVTVTATGKGGRSQELALGAAIALDNLVPPFRLLDQTSHRPKPDKILILSAGTDGIDGPTDAAGALVTESTVRRAASAGLNAQEFLSDNNSYCFFNPLGDLVTTGPTGTNVMDLQLILVT